MMLRKILLMIRRIRYRLAKKDTTEQEIEAIIKYDPLDIL